MNSFNLVVLLFCLITYGHGRPSDADEHEEIIRGAKKEKYFQHDNVGEIPLHQTESSTTENMLNRLKSIARLRMAEARKPAADPLTREELVALKELLDENLQKYRGHDERPAKRRPGGGGDPYIGQILDDLNSRPPHRPPGSPNDDTVADQQNSNVRAQMPIRRKIIRHTVFATPLGAAGRRPPQPDRVYGGDDASRIDWTSPWADYFPILIKDPFQTMMNSFSEIIEYGPAADICRHATAATTASADGSDESTNRVDRRYADSPETLRRSRRNSADATAAEEEKGVLNHVVRPFRPHHGKPTSTTDAPKVYHWATDRPAGEHNGDTGPQIKRLVVRRGGVAIAGPGGIATAGSGGTAIVGPGGSAYSSKDTASGATADAAPMTAGGGGVGGISMAGYGPQVVQGPPVNYYATYPPHQLHSNSVGYGRHARDGSGGGGSSGGADGGTAVLSTDGAVYTFPVPSRGLTAVGGPVQPAGARRRGDGGPTQRAAVREIVLPDGAKLIATGPIVYYNPEPAQSREKSARQGRGVDRDRGGGDGSREEPDREDDGHGPRSVN